MKLTIAFLLVLISLLSFSQSTQIVYLSGTGSDHTVQWDFFCTAGMNSGKWSKIAVPSCWELQGFGTYNYGLDCSKYRQYGPMGNEKGLYKYNFKADKTWSGKTVEIVFEGSMTDTEVMINGKSAGAKHQGAFYCFKYDISKLLKYDQENLLEVTVHKVSSDSSINEAERCVADFWVFGGIFRPVYLQVKPRTSIERVAINAKADGSFYADVFFNALSQNGSLEGTIKTLDGNQAGTFSIPVKKGSEKVAVTTSIINPALWSPEFPNLYRVEFQLKLDNKIVHSFTERFGFRTIEFKRRDGIYVNGVKIKFKGVCRHSFHPNSGRTTSKALSIQDVELMKEMNMNAVRMSHYPPDAHFLDVCDSLGLFVFDELAGWQWPPYNTEIGKKLLKEMVIHDVNHPSIVIWDNGNEGGWNTALDNEFAKYDPQQRHVIHPWEIFDGFDAQHYKPYNYGTGMFFHGRDIFCPTEFLHGLYDGGHGAGLEDHWSMMMSNPLSAGGFLWCFIDEGVVRRDKHDSIDCDGNHAPDGILGPFREKEGSFYTIKEIWSPVFINMKQIAPGFDGRIWLENRYSYTNLAQCTFSFELKNFNGGKKVNASISSPSIAAGYNGWLDISLPTDWKNYDALYLRARDPRGKEIYTWSWPIKNPAVISKQKISKEAGFGKTKFTEENGEIVVNANKIQFIFSKDNALLKKAITSRGETGFGNGPVLAHEEPKLKELKTIVTDTCFIIDATFEKGFEKIIWKVYNNGLLSLYYSYAPSSEGDYYGVNFDFPENKIESVSYLGRGPYRVYRNRMKGVAFDWWEKKYNNTITGQSWDYPEFKGYYSEFYYGIFKGKDQSFAIVNESEDLFLRLYTPALPLKPGHAKAPYPSGDISFLHAISSIGTKFDPAQSHGPQSQKNIFFYNKSSHQVPPMQARLWFIFDEEKIKTLNN